jgi:hypothetical protein
MRLNVFLHPSNALADLAHRFSHLINYLDQAPLTSLPVVYCMIDRI